MKNAERIALWILVTLALIGPPIGMRAQNLFNRNDGTFAQVDYASVTGGPLVLLRTLSPSGVGSIADTTSLTTAGFTKFKVMIHDMVFNTNAVNFSWLASTNGGTSYFNSGGNYLGTDWTTNTVPQSATANFTARWGLNDSTIITSSSIPFVSDHTIFNPGGSKNTMIMGMSAYPVTGPAIEQSIMSIELGAPGVNAMEWVVSAGTMTGVIEVYGIR